VELARQPCQSRFDPAGIGKIGTRKPALCASANPDSTRIDPAKLQETGITFSDCGEIGPFPHPSRLIVSTRHRQ